MRWKAYAQLVRLPNLFTAAADALAGYLVAGGSAHEVGRWGPLAGASMAIYAAGVALNDVFDRELDRVERPGRPIPSGRVSVPAAVALAAGLMAAALGLAGWVGGMGPPLVVASLLVGCVLGYDLGLRRTPLGPEVMGACRGLDVLLGMSLSARLGGPAGWAFAASIGVYVVGLTWVSRSETRWGRAVGVSAGMTVQVVAVVALVAVAWLGPRRGVDAWDPILGTAALAAVGGLVAAADRRALIDPSPETTQRAVKRGVLALVWLHVGVVASLCGPAASLLVAALWLPAASLGRHVYVT